MDTFSGVSVTAGAGRVSGAWHEYRIANSMSDLFHARVPLWFVRDSTGAGPKAQVRATVTPISTATSTPGRSIDLGPTASTMSMTMVPNGTKFYVTATWAGGVVESIITATDHYYGGFGIGRDPVAITIVPRHPAPS